MFIVAFITQFLVASSLLVNAEEDHPIILDNYKSANVCKTIGCLQAANLVLTNVNESADPCTDFYSFACGGYISRSRYPKEGQIYNRMSRLRGDVALRVKKLLSKEVDPKELQIFSLVKHLYQACMNLTSIESYGLQPLQDIIDKLGGWPVVVGDTWNETKFEWTETDSKLRQMGYNPKNIFNIFVFNDVYNGTRKHLYIDSLVPGVLGSSLKKGFQQREVQIYYHHMVNVAVLFGAERKRARQELKESLTFESELYKLSTNKSDIPNLNLSTIENLQTVIPQISWSKYLNSFTEPSYHLDDREIIKIRNPHYMVKLHEFLSKTPKRVVANYFVWRTVAESLPYLSKDAYQLALNYDKLISNSVKTRPRWKECLKFTADKNGLMVGVSSLYIRNYFNDNIRNIARSIVSSILDEFKSLLTKSTWLHKGAREAAIRKSEFMKQVIAYPNELINDETLEKYTENLNLHPDNHFENFLSLNRFHFNNLISGLRETSDKQLWIVLSDSTVVSAYYYGVYNAFAVLAAILQPPLFNAYWPHYAQYGSIGLIIGHEMMHAFDTKNIQFDYQGSYNHWLTSTEESEFKQRVDCYVNQYSQYYDEDDEFNVDGEMTKNENLADNIGLKVAYNAYKAWERNNPKVFGLPGVDYTPDQIFWITSVNFLCGRASFQYRLNQLLTDEHTPEDFRTLGMMSNSRDFAKAFNCPLGSRMNPENKCELW